MKMKSVCRIACAAGEQRRGFPQAGQIWPDESIQCGHDLRRKTHLHQGRQQLGVAGRHEELQVRRR